MSDAPKQFFCFAFEEKEVENPCAKQCEDCMKIEAEDFACHIQEGGNYKRRQHKEWCDLKRPEYTGECTCTPSAYRGGGVAVNKYDRQRRMERAVLYMQKFMSSYSEQIGYADYSDETYIDDILYGLGASLSDEYQFAGGFRKWKDVLRKHLKRS